MAFGNERTQILSTEKMVDYARRSPKHRFLVATETGILHRLEKEAPGKRFEPVREDAVCRFMKVTTLDKVRDSLRDMQHRITVEPEIADRARLAIERMVAIGA
jgi:quinolinate synthase